MSRPAERAAERVLVLAPTGRDAEMIRDRICADGMACDVCSDVPALLAGIASGAGAAVVAQEALSQAHAERLLAILDAQPPWSDIPVLLLAELPPKHRQRLVSRFFERANVTLLQRPLAIGFFLSSIRAAVRARQRQYEMRDLHRELERAIQLSEMFVGILGHDLRTPLSAMRTSAEVIVRLSPEARALRAAGRILSSADRMTRMIEQILDFARIRRGHGLTLRPTDVQLADLCRQAAREVEDARPEAAIVVHQLGDPAGVWDPDRLAQVLSNLLGNAIEHGTAGAPVTLTVDGSDREVVRVQVENAGAIGPDVLPTLFEAFRRAVAAAPETRSSGLGLGLYIAREIARAHGGEVGVESTANRTRFAVSLPRDSRRAGAGLAVALQG